MTPFCMRMQVQPLPHPHPAQHVLPHCMHYMHAAAAQPLCGADAAVTDHLFAIAMRHYVGTPPTAAGLLKVELLPYPAFSTKKLNASTEPRKVLFDASIDNQTFACPSTVRSWAGRRGSRGRCCLKGRASWGPTRTAPVDV